MAKDVEAQLRALAEGVPIDLARAQAGDVDTAQVLRMCRSNDPARVKAGCLRAAVAVWRLDHAAALAD